MLSQQSRLFVSVCVFLLCTFGSVINCMTIVTHGYTILIDGKPFAVKGVVYSPTPIGMSPTWYPYGDWFLNQYVDLWERDFPIITGMGANTIRILGWDLNYDHTAFLNKADEHGLKVIVQYNLANAYTNPIKEEWQRQGILGSFKWQVSKYIGHPALLGWNFGVELNGAWNGWLQAFSDAYGCGYNAGQYPSDPNGCYFNPDSRSSTTCGRATECVYQNMFGFINTAAKYAKDAMGNGHLPHLIFSSFADVDLVPLRLHLYEKYAPLIDAWGQQIYRGKDFGVGESDFIAAYAASSSKPLIITEYGVDAYKDPCGTSTSSPCYNTEYNAPRGFGEDVDTQAEWVSSLTGILLSQSSAHLRGPVAGGFVMSYVDEAWKGSMGVTGCWGPIPYPKPGFDASQCEYRAHVTCPQPDIGHSSICGYSTPAAPDGYANVAWYGIMRPEIVQNDQNKVTPRLVYEKLKFHWLGPPSNTWVYLILTCGVFSLIMVLYVYAKYRRRLSEVAAENMPLASKRASSSSSSSSSASGTGPSTSSSSSSLSSTNSKTNASPPTTQTHAFLSSQTSSSSTPSSSSSSVNNKSPSERSPLLKTPA